ncbi:MAG: polysaccharide deacetylase family protein [Eubacteriales bacterium]|nr:polysaccharide deacetylase family protein [Eubacteriales bacterium]
MSEQHRKTAVKRTGAVLLSLILLLVPLMLSAGTQEVSADTGEKLIAFTFDDGPSGVTTPTLLYGLRQRGVQATFFMNGVNGPHGTRAHEDLLWQMLRDGHQLANHTYSHHVPFNGLSGSAMISECDQVASDLYKVMGGSYNYIVRIPGGAQSAGISANVAHPMIVWSVDTLDWKYRNADTVYQNIMNNAGDGSIVLMHDLYASSVQGALRAIDSLQAQGYEFVTVSELYRRKGLSLDGYQTYFSAKGYPTLYHAYQAPVIDRTDNGYRGSSISLSTPDNVTLYYTLDGTYPNMSDHKWTGQPFTMNGGQIRVVGYDSYGTRTPESSMQITRPDLPDELDVSEGAMFRMYNPNTGEHFYTSQVLERRVLYQAGWSYEGIAWKAPTDTSRPVYRLYNPNAGDHHYTMAAVERDMLVSVGWSDEGIGWYSADESGVPLYRQYNPNAETGTHNYTTNIEENNLLVTLGWKAEGIGWYGIN